MGRSRGGNEGSRTIGVGRWVIVMADGDSGSGDVGRDSGDCGGGGCGGGGG